jgi:hypothetical protein
MHHSSVAKIAMSNAQNKLLDLLAADESVLSGHVGLSKQTGMPHYHMAALPSTSMHKQHVHVHYRALLTAPV